MKTLPASRHQAQQVGRRDALALQDQLPPVRMTLPFRQDSKAPKSDFISAISGNFWPLAASAGVGYAVRRRHVGAVQVGAVHAGAASFAGVVAGPKPSKAIRQNMHPREDYMRGIVEALLIPSRGALPHYLEFARQDARKINESFDARLLKLSQFLGHPISDKLADWYPSAARMASWRRQTKTVSLILERHNRHGWLATLLWCLTDEEIAFLLEARRTRATCIAIPDTFGKHFAEELHRIAKRAPGLALALSTKILFDDLAALRPDDAVSLVAGMLRDTDGEIRCEAAELMLRMEGEHGLPHVLPLFHDPLDWVRSDVLGLIARYGDDSVVPAVIEKLRTDADPGVRGNAAFALGHLGSPEAIPALIAALETDNEVDQLGHSPSSISATALDNILGTNETRIKLDDGLCKLAPWPSNHERLKGKAMALYEQWKKEEEQ